MAYNQPAMQSQNQKEQKYQADFIQNIIQGSSIQPQLPFSPDPRMISHNVHMQYDIWVTAKERYETNLLSRGQIHNDLSRQPYAFPFSSCAYNSWAKGPAVSSSALNVVGSPSLNSRPVCSPVSSCAMGNFSSFSSSSCDEISRLSTPSPSPLSLSPYLQTGYGDPSMAKSLTPSYTASTLPCYPLGLDGINIPPISNLNSPNVSAIKEEKTPDANSPGDSVNKSDTGLCPDSGYASPSPDPAPSDSEDKEKENRSSDSSEIHLQELTNVNPESLNYLTIAPNTQETQYIPVQEKPTDSKTTTKQKPEESFVEIISHAILSRPQEKILLSEIYDYCVDKYEYFRSTPPTWKNSIRHNLSINECFTKGGRAPNGKGSYWVIHPACVADFRAGDFNRRKARNKIQAFMRSEIRANVYARRMRQSYSHVMHSTPKSTQRTQTPNFNMGAIAVYPQSDSAYNTLYESSQNLMAMQQTGLVSPQLNQWYGNSASPFAGYAPFAQNAWLSPQSDCAVSNEYKYSVDQQGNEVKTICQL